VGGRELSLNTFQRGLATSLIAAGQRHLRPSTGQLEGGVVADSTVGPSDEHRLASLIGDVGCRPARHALLLVAWSADRSLADFVLEAMHWGVREDWPEPLARLPRLNDMTAMSRLVAPMTAAMAILVVVGCGNSADPADRADVGGGVATSQPTFPEPSDRSMSPTAPRHPTRIGDSPAPPSPTFTEDLPVTTPPAGKGRFMTIRGTIQPGVEPGCLILSTDNEVFQLVGPPTANLKAGMTVEVSGAPDKTLVTTCQQGTPFVVTKIS
jgi:hypothetical protein